jgi:hypothetical protein
LDIDLIKSDLNGADEAAHKLVGGAASNAPTAPPKVCNQGRTFVVGLEQVGTPRFLRATPWGVNQYSADRCVETHDYQHRLFFYRLENVEEVDSVCTSKLEDYWAAPLYLVSDAKAFDSPSFPNGQWDVGLFGEQFTYRVNGQNAGGLWKGDRKIDCTGDLKHHGKHAYSQSNFEKRSNRQQTRNPMSGV